MIGNEPSMTYRTRSPEKKKLDTTLRATLGRWKKVVYAADCDEDGNCPNCAIDFAECPCPGPTQDEYEYEERRGILFARRKLH